MSNSVEPTPSAEELRESIRREEETLHRVVAYIDEGMRNGRISDTSGELLIAAAERAHDRAVRPLQRMLSDRLREEWQA